MPRNPDQILSDIENRCERIIQHTKELSEDEFLEDDWSLDASTYNLLVIGEAAKNLPESFVEQYGQKIPFDAIIGARDIYAHEYFRVDPEMLWKTVTEDVPELLEAIEHVD